MRAHTQSSHRGVSNMCVCVCVFSTTGQAVNRRTAQSRMHKPSPLSYQSDTLGPEMAGGRNSPCVCVAALNVFAFKLSSTPVDAM